MVFLLTKTDFYELFFLCLTFPCHWLEFILKFLVHFNSAHLHSYKEK